MEPTDNNLQKLEEDLKKLEQETSSQSTTDQPTVPVPPVVPTPDSTPPVNFPTSPQPKKSSPLILMAIVLVVVALLAAVAYAIGMQFFGNKSVPTPVATITPIVSPEPTAKAEDPTADWKTYTNQVSGFSFEYPQDYKVEERVPGFFVITSPTAHAPQEGISIESRLQSPYDTYVNAQKYINSSFTIKKTYNINNWQIYDTTGKDGMLTGLDFKTATSKYKSGVIEAETLDNQGTTQYTSIFDQILSTFKFVEATPSATP